MKKSKTVLVLFLCALFPAASYANTEAKSAEKKMISACKKEYSSAVRGKGTKEIAEWVETEESGPNADSFKKSKCYSLHEDWEKASGTEENEKTE